MNAVCRHCGRFRQVRARGLCLRCSRVPAILAGYPPAGRGAMRGVGHGTASRPLAPTPTAARPGSPGKLLVLIERAAVERSLWHPLDAA